MGGRSTIYGALALLLGTAAPLAAEPIKVVTSFSVLEDFARHVGGDKIALSNLVAANGDTHMFQPSPMDGKLVAQADVLIVNGQGFEGWMERFVESTEFDGLLVEATRGVDLIDTEHGEHHDDEDQHDDEHHDKDEHHTDEHDDHHEDAHAKHSDEHQGHDEEHHDDHQEEGGHHHHHHGRYDPHTWHSVANAKVYVANIRDGLIEADPSNADHYRQNSQAYLAELDALEQQLQQQVATLADDQRRVITSHDAFAYLGQAYRLDFTAPQGLSTESEASAEMVAKIIRQIREQGIQAVFVENVSSPRLIEQVARETGAEVGGKLYSDALSAPAEGAGSYVEMMTHNISTIVQALD